MGMPSPQQQMPIQHQVIEVKPKPKKNDIAKDIVISLGDYVGYWVVLALMFCGCLVVFRKRIKNAMRAFIKEKD